MKGSKTLTACLAVLAGLHLLVAFAGFFAPYDPGEQDRRAPYLPPMRFHVVDAQGRWHLRPFAYAWDARPGSFDQYQENLAEPVRLRFFVPLDPNRQVF